MDKVTPENWHRFIMAIRTHWPMISQEELERTEGYITQVENLIENKSVVSAKKLKKTLRKIYQDAITRH